MASKSVQVTEKEIPAVSSPHGPREANEAAEVVPERNLKRAIWTIVYGVALPCIPIVVICAVLLYIIFHYRLDLPPGLPELQVHTDTTGDQHNTLGGINRAAASLGRLSKEGGQWVYYVKYNPSTITTIASWTSRIIPYLQSSIMALVAFFAARHIVLKSKHGDESQLPNPEQLALLISTLAGTGFSPLKDVLLYRFGRKGKLVNPLPAAVSALTIIAVMALIIPLIDTWFGVATKAATVIELTPKASSLDHGRQISSKYCRNGPKDNGLMNSVEYDNSTYFWPCNIHLSGPQNCPILGSAEAGEIAISASTQNKVQNHTDALGNTFWYLGSPAQNAAQDYQATTLAVQSQCRPMTLEQCNLTFPVDGQSTGFFHCNDNFYGFLGSQLLDYAAANDSNNEWNGNNMTVGLGFSGNAELTDVGAFVKYGAFGTPNNTWSEIYTTNPLYYGAWAVGFPGPDPLLGLNLTDGSVMPAFSFTGDPAYHYSSTWGGTWMVNCSTTVHDVVYTWVNGSVASFNTSLASTDMAALISAPFIVGRDDYMSNYLYSAAAAAGSTNSSAKIAPKFADEYSKLLLAYSVGALETVLVSAQQDRSIVANIARVPLIPLYLLLATKILYVLAVIVLALAAYAFTHPAETEIVKDQLTVKGLTSAHFDRPDVMQSFAVQQLQSHIESTSTSATNENPATTPSIEIEDPSSKPLLQHASTALPESPPKSSAEPPKVGLVPAVDGTWQFVVKADGIWTSVKPIVGSVARQIILGEAQAGNLGSAGGVINAYTGK